MHHLLIRCHDVINTRARTPTPVAGAFHEHKPSELLAELQGRLPIRVELKGLDAKVSALCLKHGCCVCALFHAFSRLSARRASRCYPRILIQSNPHPWLWRIIFAGLGAHSDGDAVQHAGAAEGAAVVGGCVL